MTEQVYSLAPAVDHEGRRRGGAAPPRASTLVTFWLPIAVALSLCALHTLATWVGMGGWDQLRTDWPIARHDHPINFHYASITPDFLRESWTTAGYDPSFMAGYPKSILFPQSTTFYEVIAFLSGTTRFAFTYKITVFLSVAALPLLMLASGLVASGRGAGLWFTVALFLVYLWTDFPINYAEFGMVSYLLAVPFAGLVTLALCRYFARGGTGWWLAGTIGSTLVVLIHLTSAIIVVPAAAIAYLAAIVDARKRETPLPWTRHLGTWAIPVLVPAANAFWWWPGLLLVSLKGESGFVFSHPEGVLQRLAQVVGFADPSQPEIQVVLWALGLPGFWVLFQRDRVLGAGVTAFAAAGFGWGYLAGAVRELDFLQPGRQTFALYTCLCLGSGVAISSICNRLRRGDYRLDTWAIWGLVLVGVRLFGPSLVFSVQTRLGIGDFGRGRTAFLASDPSPRLRWVLDRVRQELQPGQRLLYEESGFDLPGIPDPYSGGRFSGVLPTLTGVEVIGGPYLHVALQTNFTQFGEGRLFGETNWDRDHFTRYARLYGISAVLCWSPDARAFCLGNPDLVQVVDDDGRLLFGRVVGFGETTIEGRAVVEPEPGVLRVRPDAAELDSRLVLSYHLTPSLRSDPPAPVNGVLLESDPVPFIGLRSGAGPLQLRLDFRPGRWFSETFGASGSD